MSLPPSPSQRPLTRLGANQRARQGKVLARALLFLPALGLLAFTLWQRSEAPPEPTSLDAPAEPMRTGTVGSIDGWEGLVLRDGAAPLRLRLEPLHPEATRQAFDAAALAAALRPMEAAGFAGEAQEGEPAAVTSEPWRLTLSVAARPGAASSSPDADVISNLSEVLVVGLESLVPPGASGTGPGDEPVDPLVALVDFPDAPLREGESCDLIFWGLRPEGPVRAVLPGIGDVQLLMKARSANRSTISIARLDARSVERTRTDITDTAGDGR